MEKGVTRQYETVFQYKTVMFLIAFPLLILLGLLMRLHQAEYINVGIGEFYSYMSLHGIGMTMLIFSMVVGGTRYVLAMQSAALDTKMGIDLFYAEVLAFLLIGVAGVVGKFAGGWYFLYPLPFQASFWTSWSIGLTYFALIILMTSWLLNVLEILVSMRKEYGGSRLLTLFSENTSISLSSRITLVSLWIAIPVLLIGIGVSLAFLVVYFMPETELPALLMKNLAMMLEIFLRQITIMMAVGWITTFMNTHELPGRQGRFFLSGWGATFLLFLLSFLTFLGHMVFPGLQRFEAWSGLTIIAALPAAIATFYLVMKHLTWPLLRNDILSQSIWIAGFVWLVSCLAGTITIMKSDTLEHTLWVNGQFHTGMLLVVILLIFYLIFFRLSSNVSRSLLRIGRLGYKIYLLAATGFIGMFFMAGVYSVPRRYSDYTAIAVESTRNMGVITAQVSAVFIVLLLLGLVLLYVAILKTLKAKEK